MDYIPVSAREAMNTQIQLSNTAHQREVADLQAAGLNPVLSAHGSGASTPGIQSDSLSEINDFLGTINSALDVAKAGLSGSNKASALESFVLQADPKSGRDVGNTHDALKNFVFSLIPENGTFMKIGNFNLQNSTVRNAIAFGIDTGGFDASAVGDLIRSVKPNSADHNDKETEAKIRQYSDLAGTGTGTGFGMYIRNLVNDYLKERRSFDGASSSGRSHSGRTGKI